MPQRDLSVRIGGDQIRVAPPEPDPGPDPGPPPTGTGLRKALWLAGLDSGQWGTYVWPDCEEADTSGSNWVESNGLIDKAIAGNGGTKGGAVKTSLIMKVTPSNNAKNADGTFKIKNPDGTFSLTGWETQFDKWYNALGTAGIAKVRLAVQNGHIRFLYVLDDFFGTGGPNSFARSVSFDEMDGCAHHVKVTRNMPWLPCAPRGPNTNLKSMAKNANGTYRQYKYLDAGWHQIRLDLHGPAPAWYTLQCDAGEDISLGNVGGMNILNGGLGTDPAWRQHPNLAGFFGMSPAEIRTVGFAAVDEPRMYGLYGWSWGIGGDGLAGDAAIYLAQAGIQSALSDVWNHAATIPDPSINIRGDLVAA